LRSRESASFAPPETYLELLPTPAHDFKAIPEWMTDEIFHRYMKPTQSGRVFQGIGSAAAACCIGRWYFISVASDTPA
jgi:NADH dehydrogenase